MATDELVQIPNSQKSPGDEDSNQLLWFALGTGGYNVIKVAGNRPRFQDPHSNGSGFVDDICGSSGNLNAEQNAFQGFGSSAGWSTDDQQSAYRHSSTKCTKIIVLQGRYSSVSPSQLPYQNVNPHQAPYRSINVEQQPYQHMRAQGSYYY
ncbi:uncharacterized protein LOC132623159 [Lycium barbarum]|uniref:uncharacterized protein LOC132623159 n=1 Tax=Lycium barbarum TaxID=112863 RepID=UPI00293E4CE0|nr:uncharacterized protein LOC132623159 [Lycium barbarum]XP_060193852.1 uncharacterized protein LOC132623159 [Lycium barbarum]XP_060193853.1 uncharacterized protein LOC132623159 [Lycium barbarum]XP_060193854.1 uncharacterized protein LOC132623159 [Lycium barbarum]XP_060193855.1 uncharacterized protein LOC132623159 [Lycium barbarum]XP_060193857.1 uncharacterized protein LOC132623159 [Lycium barbarum]XP_060193858.1 uncharacterized protein LOC132623159 [Lycium barbarum]